ncbi:hypothetical protein [Streptomyces sp. NPDC048191]|uniref:hypothetical protein n=1 Tax=Streptomyces sp. NPDC048191 TaxID=3155484 RepID=UPI0033C67554
MGHSTARAALIYQYAGAGRDRLIADAVSNLAGKGRKKNQKAKKKQDRKPEGHAGDTADWSGPPETIRARRRNHPLTWP